MKTPKTPPVKARKGWLSKPSLGARYSFSGRWYDNDRPVYVLPATREAYDQMVEQIALSIWGAPVSQDWHRDEARAALKAIGITRPSK